MANNGELIQNKLQAALKEYVKTQPGFQYRFYDTKSTAGGWLPAQPGDYFLLIPGHCILIECKSSERGTSLLTMAHANKAQIAKHRLWHRSGHPSLYLYLNLTNNEVEWYKGSDVIAKRKTPLCQGNVKYLLEHLINITRGFYDPSRLIPNQQPEINLPESVCKWPSL